ncbi:hypothetical protein AMS68_006741 [Peltaster fructicola]|uniref:Peptidase S53 domain-containing protein n=1 Tax=Peltaster fructicola TaxID=286661 RepID=A0A6H0Y2I4_9PEZI|nr:hypothetical protein AMS68_006741 [Peltaster fructicola]
MRSKSLFSSALACLLSLVHSESIADAAAAIANPYSPRYRQFLTATEAIKLAKQLPAISFPFSATQATRRGRTQKARDVPRQKSSRRDTCGANDNVTPSCIRQIYGIEYTPEPNRVTFAVYATEAATYNPSDLNNYLEQYRPEAQGAAYDVIGTGDSSEPSNIEAGFEVALDTQTILGNAWPAQGQLYDIGGVFGPIPGQPYKPFVDFLMGLISNESIPSVVSFSESMAEDFVNPDYARTLCTMMALAGARGVSLLFSSGDNGPSGDTADGPHKVVFEPEFPASCPWVTAVGGTTDLENEVGATSSTIPPFAATFYTASGGGFSNLFEAPAWQKDVTAEYISQYVPSSYENISGFNARGRGIPDVSAFSTNFPTYVNGATLPLAGTSASTPLWAAVIVLLNDYEASNGRPPLGFLNPWLYSLSEESNALYDIVDGGNNKGGCNAATGCNLTDLVGYDVTPGWDAVTGLGRPIFDGLKAALDEFECL